MKNEIKLNGVGVVEGTPAGELKVGDVIRLHLGAVERITSVEFTKTGKTIILGIEYMEYNGEIKQSERRFRINRLVNIVAYGNTVITGTREFDVVEETEETEVAKITEYETSVVLDLEHNQLAFNNGYEYVVKFKDRHGTYLLEDLIFVGVQDNKLKFDDKEGNTLHLEPSGIIKAWIFPKRH